MVKIVGIEVAEVGADKENAGQEYFVLHCMAGTITKPKAMKIAVFLTGNEILDEKIKKDWNGYKESGKFPSIDYRMVVVGDTDLNPGTTPLPPFRVKMRDGSWSEEVYTTMKVYVEFDNGQPTESPRRIAMRYIKNLCQAVEMGDNTPEMHDEGDPLGA